LFGQFVLGRVPPQSGFQRLGGFLQFAGLGAYQPGHPIHRAQFVQHRSPDAGNAVRFELDAPRQIEGVDGIHQSEHAGRDQVIQFDPLGQTLPDPFGIVADQRQVFLNQPISEALVVLVLLVRSPDLLDIRLFRR